ncbi:MAG: aspartate dehydrogenase [Roseburia sp.]|jgi:hypothetical protein|nr:aspartate dehydrogenase [Roseburia sp.]
MFGKNGKKKGAERLSYDPSTHRAVLKCSICNGEQVAGIQNRATGKVEEVMLIRDKKDLETFCAMCGTTDLEKIY